MPASVLNADVTKHSALVSSSAWELLSISCLPFSGFSFHSDPLGSQTISAAKGQRTR